MHEEFRRRLRHIAQSKIDKIFLDAMEEARIKFPDLEILAFKKTTSNIKIAKAFCKTRDARIIRHRHYLLVACDSLAALEAPIAIDIPITLPD
jgi:hypothetical protein